MGDELGVDAGLAHPAGDQLGVLAAEVDDEHRAATLRLPGRAGGRVELSGERQRLRRSQRGDDLNCADSWAHPW